MTTDIGAEVLGRIAELKSRGHAWLLDEVDRTYEEYRRIGREQAAVGMAHLEARTALEELDGDHQ